MKLNKNKNSKFLNSDIIFQDSHNDYVNKISLINDSKKIFTDKTPLNFKYVGFIKKIFPSSKIIICKRDKYDICWSNYKNYFAENIPFFALYEDL